VKALRTWLWACAFVLTIGTLVASPVFAQVPTGPESAGEPQATEAREPDGGDGFDLSTVIDAIGSIGVPIALGVGGFAAAKITDRRQQKREYNREQLANSQDFLGASGQVVRRLQSFADGRDRADDVAPLREELYGVSEASSKITDEQINGLGREFFARTVDVINSVGIKDRSTQPIARDAIRAFDALRRGVEDFRRELTDQPRKRPHQRNDEFIATAAPPPGQEEELRERGGGEEVGL
jgi:hypothetical protein